MKSLQEIAKLHRGKASDRWTSYLNFYDERLSGYRDAPISMLEIGVQNGGSLEIWAQYFAQSSTIIGCDIDERCKLLKFDNKDISTVVGDITDHKTICEIREIKNAFEIIIDDGSHHSRDIIMTFLDLFPNVKNDGVYIIEDLHCSYWQHYGGGLYHPYSAQAFFKALVDVMNSEFWGVEKQISEVISGILKFHKIEADALNLDHIHSIEFTNSICIVRKKDPEMNVIGLRKVYGKNISVETDIHDSKHDVAQYDQTNNYFSKLKRPLQEQFFILDEELKQRDEELTQLKMKLSQLEQVKNALLSELSAIKSTKFWKAYAYITKIF